MAPEYFAVFYFMVTMCFSPGPNNILCTAHAAKYGHKKTIPLILGIAIGFTTIGIIIACLSDWLSSYKFIFNIFVYLGAAYIFYLAWKVGFSSFISNDENHEEKKLGLKTGLILQLVNGKVWFHLLTLMTTVLKPLDLSLKGKVIANFVNTFFGMSALVTWTLAGALLKKIFSSKKQAKILNGFLGLSLAILGIWLLFS